MSQPGPTPPAQRYARDIEDPDFIADPAQRTAVAELQRCYDDLVASPPRPLRRHWKPVTGVYLWGGVGRGKTYLMDCFYASLPFTRKRRSHFHRFMQEIHKRRRDHQDQRDPLARIASELAHDRVLCFDEFYVADVADAMILSRLTASLFAEGVTLVATSNLAPDELYADGLQRRRFLPAIDRINSHCRVVHLDGGQDYRLRALERAEIYHHPLDDAAEKNLTRYFEDIASGQSQCDIALTINGRDIQARRAADDVLWCGFDALCETPRSAADYTAIARCYHTVLLSGVPQLTGDDDNAARRFINLVDVFYDRRVNLIISAATPISSLYQGKRLDAEFDRVRSRLQEMSSRDYLAAAHRP